MSYKSLFLMVIPIVATIALGYWTHNKFKENEQLYLRHIKSLNEQIVSLGNTVITLEETEKKLIEENKNLKFKISQFKNSNSNNTIKAKTKNNEKIVPVNHAASKRINQFLAKRYQYKEG